ncbi:MAG: ankyrin repeat domain-containing protein [Magnetococcales bacterium]|nr:ankyrin repeat domain-containing protein [Magnetococcales bacterium]
MAKYITTLFVIISMSLATSAYAQDKDLEKYLLNNIKTTMIDVNATGSRGSTLLHWAAKSGYPTIVQYLIAKGADTTRFDNYGTTPIQAAIDGMTPQTGKIVHLLQTAINEKGKKGSEQIYNELVTSTNNYNSQKSSPTDNFTLPTNTEKTVQEIIKAKDLEIKLLQNKISQLNKSPNKTSSGKPDEKSKILIKSLSYELEETKEKLTNLAEENKQLKGQISSINFFDYFKIDYLFSAQGLRKK